MKKLETIKLENGLTIYLYNDKRRHSTFFNFITKCGGESKNFYLDNKEYHIQDGVAHILEHYIVECNEKGNFLKELGEAQMSTNASTSPRITSFYFETVENVLHGVRTILEGVNNIKFDKEKLEKLKNPIYQEIRSKLDNKFYHLNRCKINNLFNNIDYRDIGGLLEEVEKTTIEDLEIFYNAFYQPNNQFIVVAGNFDRDSVVDEIESFYKKYNYYKHELKLIPYNEKLSVKKKNDIIYFPTPEDYVELSFKIDMYDYSPVDALDLDFYLGCFFDNFFGLSSITHKELVNNNIITDGIVCGNSRIDNYLIINIGAYTSNRDVFVKTILDKINKLDLFDEECFILDKSNSHLMMILREENIFKVIFPFIDNIIYFNYPYLDDPKDYERFTYDDYINYIKKLDFSNYITITIRNDKSTQKI